MCPGQPAKRRVGFSSPSRQMHGVGAIVYSIAILSQITCLSSPDVQIDAKKGVTTGSYMSLFNNRQTQDKQLHAFVD
jgi:hypothetical protein